jgi:succinate dehydrogenase/fumarate reductase flavoprotein subunit
MVVSISLLRQSGLLMQDRIVVGGGIAGSVASTALVRSGLPTLLLE